MLRVGTSADSASVTSLSEGVGLQDIQLCGADDFMVKEEVEDMPSDESESFMENDENVCSSTVDGKSSLKVEIKDEIDPSLIVWENDDEDDLDL